MGVLRECWGDSGRYCCGIRRNPKNRLAQMHDSKIAYKLQGNEDYKWRLDDCITEDRGRNFLIECQVKVVHYDGYWKSSAKIQL
eukprot:scaffold66102_cov42-Attheya_sp.AAC.1